MSQLLTISPNSPRNTSSLYENVPALRLPTAAPRQAESGESIDRTRELNDLGRAVADQSREADARTGAQRADELTLSDHARLAGEPDPAAQAARLERIRSQISRGEYLTFDKIEVAVERLHEEIAGK